MQKDLEVPRRYNINTNSSGKKNEKYHAEFPI